jgi:hypothetical protein
MYTGTMISDLMAIVERAERMAEEQHVSDELHAIYTMQIAETRGDRIYMGAA